MKPGDMVVCISDNWNYTNKLVVNWPQKGMVYTVRDMRPGDTPSKQKYTYLLLEEINNPIDPHWKVEVAFNKDWFRPVRHTDISVFTEILKPIPLKVD